MRRIAHILVGIALVAAATWYCSSDSPAPTPPGGGGGPTGASALQIRLFTSNANPVAGACTLIEAVVTLNGVNVSDGTGVSFSTDLPSSFFSQNGLPLISVVTQGGTTTTALCSTSAGLATVRANASVGSQSGSATISIAFQPSPQVAPFLTFCSPSFGPNTGGTTLTINGGRFFGDATTTRATFTAAGITREALVTSVSTTAVSVITPAFPEATSPSVPVNITLTFGTKSTTPVTLSVPNCFSFGTATASTPTITALIPSSGSNEGNTLVTIAGSGFVAPLQVFFGPVEAQVLSVGYNQILVLTPPASGAGLPNLNQTVTVRVHEVTSGLDATLSNAFRFVTPIQITAMDNSQQRVDQPFTAVTIHGQGFLAPVAVSLAGIPARVISVSATELLVLPSNPFLSGCSDLSGPAIVTNIDSGSSATGPTFIYLVAQTKAIITSVTPSAGPPGTVVHITGANMGNVTSVTFGSRSAGIVSVSSTEVVVTVPDSGATPPSCPAGTPAGTPLNVGSAVDVTVISAITGCSTVATGAFQYRLPCTASADLSVTKTASPNPVVSGGTLTYSIQVNNAGPNAADNVVVTDALPGGTTFLSCTPSQGSCSASGQVVTANLGTVGSPGFATVTIQVRVDAEPPTTITNLVGVSSSTPDASTANNTSSVTTNVTGAGTPTPGGSPTPTPVGTPATTVDLVLSKTASPGTLISGSTLTFQLGITNNKAGSGTAAGVVLTDPLPVGTTFQSCVTSQGSCTGPAVGANGTVTANLGSIPSPGFGLVTIVATVTAPGGSSFTNTGVVTSATFDTDISNNTASASVTVTSPPASAQADLSVVKTSFPNPVTTGGTLTYTINVNNGGPDPADNVIVNDPIPSGTTFASCVTLPLKPCVGPAIGTNGTVTANLGTLGVGVNVATVFITVNVTAASPSVLTNTAVISSSTVDPNPANNFGTTTTNVNPSATPTPTPVPTPTPTPVFADLVLTKTGFPNPVFTDKDLTYTINVTNNGPNAADTVEMSDPLPPQTTFVSATAPCTLISATVRCELGTMASGASTTLTIVVHVNVPGGGSVTNTASCTSNTSDPNLVNNSQTITTTVNP